MYREVQARINKILNKSKPPIILILGLRQTGKTTLAKNICQGKKFQLFNFDLLSDRKEFIENDRHSLANFAERYKKHIIIIDEVQKEPEATSVIKYLYDQYNLKFILTGSSELKIKKNISDNLTGRSRIFRLYPLNLREILMQKKIINDKQKIEFDDAQIELQKYLVFGSLPTLQNIKQGDYQIFLKNFIDSLLAKDVLEIADIKNSIKIFTLAKFLAMQIGQLVNVNELAMLLELSRPSIYNYLDILEQLNIIVRANPISINERKAISEKFKIYFTDLGIRNALINNFDSLPARMDIGVLLENAAYIGIKKGLDYQEKNYKLGFFRNQAGSEIDLVLKINKQELLYEVKTTKKDKKNTKIKYITKNNVYQYL